jgi:hypothetical protein
MHVRAQRLPWGWPQRFCWRTVIHLSPSYVAETPNDFKGYKIGHGDVLFDRGGGSGERGRAVRDLRRRLDRSEISC